MAKILIFTNQQLYRYYEALEKVGLKAHIGDRVDNLKNFDGLLLPGGADIEPSIYGQENTASRGIDKELDERTIETFNYFFVHDKPVLGICKGLQIINVALGGTLMQHIPNHMCDGVINAHEVFMQKENKLSTSYPPQFLVNSVHHQAVERLGKGLFVTYKSQEGIIEGIEHENKPVFAVQWHPERVKSGEAVFLTFNKLFY